MNRQQRQEKKAFKRARQRKSPCSVKGKTEDFVYHEFALTPPELGVYVSLVNGHRLIVDEVRQRDFGRYQVITKSFDANDDYWNATLSDMEWGALNHMSLYTLDDQEAA
ncbi:hypothetical protein VII00023_12176 [Vibrio ichthyoenteri ATCC 700023]|uniref:Uncharacterized protein n=1 Tax=Vibrio ichthyoenteri ATCC 700023 TaxID=870968 RepID=F9S607_9VIBR|nr:hypothetical protein [Vibrio ichthyoenteri]EGU34191.1 hypothetical protein VII00023_12176 [Vibrio ichthyoenteri ATCC 700023]